MLNGAVGQIF